MNAAFYTTKDRFLMLSHLKLEVELTKSCPILMKFSIIKSHTSFWDVINYMQKLHQLLVIHQRWQSFKTQIRQLTKPFWKIYPNPQFLLLILHYLIKEIFLDWKIFILFAGCSFVPFPDILCVWTYFSLIVLALSASRFPFAICSISFLNFPVAKVLPFLYCKKL